MFRSYSMSSFGKMITIVDDDFTETIPNYWDKIFILYEEKSNNVATNIFRIMNFESNYYIPIPDQLEHIKQFYKKYYDKYIGEIHKYMVIQ